MLLDKEHYASDSIGPKTDEIRSITTQVEEAFQKRNDVLVQSLSFLNKIDEVFSVQHKHWWRSLNIL